MIIAIFVLGIILYIITMVSVATDKHSLMPILMLPFVIGISVISAWALSPVCGVIFLILELFFLVALITIMIKMK